MSELRFRPSDAYRWMNCPGALQYEKRLDLKKDDDPSGFAEEEEISIVFIRDRIAKSMRAAFRGFIGTAETPQTQGSLLARANSVMQAFLSQRLITAFANLSVVRDSVEPRQWNIRVAVQPVFPINWIYIRVDVGTL